MDEVAKAPPAGSSNYADERGLGSVTTPGEFGVEEDKKGRGKKWVPSLSTAFFQEHND